MSKTINRSIKVMAACAVATIFGVAANVGHAGTIQSIGAVSGGGILLDSAFETNSPNNDDATVETKNVLFLKKKFRDFFTPMDIVINVANSTRTTEYNVSEKVINLTGIPWTDYHIELGFGVGDNFVASNDQDFLDFDQPYPQAPPTTSSHFSNVVVSDVGEFDDVLTFLDGVVPHATAHFLGFPLDIPNWSAEMPADARILDGDRVVGYRFTLRQRPSNDVIPEPSTMAIWSLLGALGLTIGWWRKRRAA